MRTPKALLIDLDDTLICYDGYATEAWTEACEQRLPPGAAAGNEIQVEPLIEEILRGSDWYFSDPERHRIGRNNLEETRRVFVRNALGKLGRPDDERADEIGDNYEWEVVAPGRLGFTTVWVDKRGTGLPADASTRPDAVIHSFAELLDLIAAAEKTV